MFLKINLHMHTADDPKDNISYSTYQAIDRAKELNFNALALTCHEKFAYKKEYADYAEQKGILLIPGIEAKIENKHVVILNCDKKSEDLKTFKDLKRYKNENPRIFILAPHPFVWHYSRASLGKKLKQNINLFDAVELTVFSNKIFNFNKKAKRIAKKYNKPLIATSDTHFLKDLNRNYVLVEVPTPQGGRDPDRSVGAIFEAIKNNKLKNHIQTMSIFSMLRFTALLPI